MTKKIIKWQSDEVLSVLKDTSLSLKEKSEKINASYWLTCRKMKELGIVHNIYWKGGLGRPTTNKERKARYNAKRKAIGWKYLYQVE